MQNPLLTNSLLFVISILLLVQVIQTSRLHDQLLAPALEVTSAESAPMAPAMPPHGAPAKPMATDMIFHAMVGFMKGCDKTKPLAVCDSPAAQKVKEQVNGWASEGKGIRELFDQIVATFGEQSLTEEARQIRAQRRKN